MVGTVAPVVVGQRPQFAWPGAMSWPSPASPACSAGFYLAVVRQGNLDLVITASALYPLISIALGFAFLYEAVSATQGAGIFLAIAAMLPTAG